MYSYFKLFFLSIYYFGYLLSASEKEISLVLEDNFGEMSYEAKDDMAYNGGDYNWDILDVNYKYTNYSSNNFRIQILDGNRISSISLSFGTCDRIIKVINSGEIIKDYDNPGFFSLRYIYGIYDASEIPFFQRFQKNFLFKNFKFSPTIFYSRNRVFGTSGYIPYTNTIGFGLQANFYKLKYLIPYLSYQKIFGTFKSSYGLGVSANITRIKNIFKQG